MKCKCCGENREIYKSGYCEPCYNKVMDVIKTSRAALRQALDESKGPNPDKERVLALTDTACAALDKLTRDRVPFYDGGHKYVAQEIRRNLGASAGPRASAASSPPLALTVALGVVLAALALVWANTLGDLRDERALNRDLTAQVEQLQATVADLDAQLEAVQKTAAAAPTVMLENGNFVAGTDFAAGTYDIEAVSGFGNVYSDNAFDGGINAIMGVKSEDSSGLAEQKYSNIRLPDGTTLTLRDVKVRLRLVEAY